MNKKRIVLDIPVQLGFWILNLAKMRMLSFYYDFCSEYINRADFQLISMDTNSSYMCLSTPTLSEAIKPTMQEKFHKGIKGLCGAANPEADSNLRWFPRECCKNHKLYDKRETGLMKEEATGIKMIALCSKTYVLCSTKEKTKVSCKGVQKTEKILKNAEEIFETVISTKEAQGGENRGFRARSNGIQTYWQSRNAFSYFYIKRKVLEDGISTTVLPITLKKN